MDCVETRSIALEDLRVAPRGSLDRRSPGSKLSGGLEVLAGSIGQGLNLGRIVQDWAGRAGGYSCFGVWCGVRIVATVKVKGETGVEMAALTAASITALTLYDMAKALETSIEVRSIRLLNKSGGKSGDYRASFW